MSFKEVQTLDADTTISLGGSNRKTGKKNPQQVEGYYLGNRKVDSPKAKAGFSYLHFLQTKTGNLGVWGKTDLDRKLLAVVPGTMVRATCVGTVPTPNGDMYKYKVEIDADNTIDVSQLSAGEGTGDFSADNGDADSNDTEGNSIGEGYNDGGAQEESSAQAVARQAQVQAMLNKSKSKTARS